MRDANPHERWPLAPDWEPGAAAAEIVQLVAEIALLRPDLM